MIRYICFDADDTLWANESYFRGLQAELAALLAAFADAETVEARLHDCERRNIPLYGYGVKGFLLSMVETALDISAGRVDPQGLQALIGSGKQVLAHPVELIDGAVETLKALHGAAPLYLITKGDLWHQNAKIKASALTEMFAGIDVVMEKDPPTYAEVFARRGIAPQQAIMIGNSLPSDCMPVLALGGWAAHIPTEMVAFFDQPRGDEASERLFRLARVREVPALIARLNAGSAPAAQG